MVEYTTSLRLELQGTGTNRSIWGNKANNNFTLIEKGIAGFKTIAMSDADYTLTTADALDDDARNFMLQFNGTLTQTRSIIIPQVSKTYLINNNTIGGYDLTVTNGIDSVTAGFGNWTYVWTNGTNVYRRIGTPAYVERVYTIPNPPLADISVKSGYQKLGNGLVLQWLMRPSSGQNSTYIMNWETPFSAEPFMAMSTGSDNWVSSTTASTVTISTGANGGFQVNIFGIGPE